jgi:carboxylesterase type B
MPSCWCTLLLTALATSARAISPIVDLGYRKYRGQEHANGLTEWLGIQYAAPPVGELRFAAPKDPPHKNGVEDADKVNKLYASHGNCVTETLIARSGLFANSAGS